MNVSEILRNGTHLIKGIFHGAKTDSPYHIWLSEIILQQTRVNQGLEYYLKFASRNIPPLKIWPMLRLMRYLNYGRDLGYYTRARNLHATAKIIVNNLNGVISRYL